MRSRGTPSCSAGTYCVPCAAGPPPPAKGAGETGGGGGAVRGAATGADAGAAVGAADPEIAASISCLLTRPPAPVPGTLVRSMPCSLAIRRTSGEECTRAPSFEALAAGATAAGCGVGGGTICGFGAGAGAGAAAAAGAAFAGAGAGAGAAAAEPAASITATTVLMGTVWPSLTLISFSTPAEGDGISASTLSVEISKSGSSRSILSPGFFSHLVMVPSKMLSPIWGMTTSAAMSISSNRYCKNLCRPLRLPPAVYRAPSDRLREEPYAKGRLRTFVLVFRQLPRRVQHFFLVRQKVLLERRRVRYRRVQSRDPHQRPVQVAESAFTQNSRNFPGDAARFGVLVYHQTFVGF